MDIAPEVGTVMIMENYCGPITINISGFDRLGLHFANMGIHPVQE